jgi:hypothetical protein
MIERKIFSQSPVRGMQSGLCFGYISYLVPVSHFHDICDKVFSIGYATMLLYYAFQLI